jgi:predicted esterase
MDDYFLSKKNLKIPSFHVWGATDKLFENYRSERLRDIYLKENTTTMVHDGGHFIPVKTEHL